MIEKASAATVQVSFFIVVSRSLTFEVQVAEPYSMSGAFASDDLSSSPFFHVAQAQRCEVVIGKCEHLCH